MFFSVAFLAQTSREGRSPPIWCSVEFLAEYREARAEPQEDAGGEDAAAATTSAAGAAGAAAATTSTAGAEAPAPAYSAEVPESEVDWAAAVVANNRNAQNAVPPALDDALAVGCDGDAAMQGGVSGEESGRTQRVCSMLFIQVSFRRALQ